MTDSERYVAWSLLCNLRDDSKFGVLWTIAKEQEDRIAQMQPLVDAVLAEAAARKQYYNGDAREDPSDVLELYVDSDVWTRFDALVVRAESKTQDEIEKYLKETPDAGV